MDYAGKRDLLTEASGFIGSHLAEELVTCSASVRAFLHYNSPGEEENLKYVASEIRREIDVVYGDLTDPDAVNKAVRGAAHVFHLGALIAIPYSYVHPYSFVQSNIVGTANILNACLELGTQRLVTTSTSEVDGAALRVPMDETHRLVAGSTKAELRLGWMPHYSFRDALEQTVDWYEVYEQAITHVHSL